MFNSVSSRSRPPERGRLPAAVLRTGRYHRSPASV